MRVVLGGVISLALAVQSLCAQGVGKDESYVDKNQSEPVVLKVSRVAGVARDGQGTPIQGVDILVFSEQGHKLIAKAETDKEGEFFLEEVPPGRYRLVAKSLFCPANIPIWVRRSGKKDLFLHLIPNGMDSCSYGTLKN